MIWLRHWEASFPEDVCYLYPQSSMHRAMCPIKFHPFIWFTLSCLTLKFSRAYYCDLLKPSTYRSFHVVMGDNEVSNGVPAKYGKVFPAQHSGILTVSSDAMVCTSPMESIIAAKMMLSRPPQSAMVVIPAGTVSCPSIDSGVLTVTPRALTFSVRIPTDSPNALVCTPPIVSTVAAKTMLSLPPQSAMTVIPADTVLCPSPTSPVAIVHADGILNPALDSTTPIVSTDTFHHLRKGKMVVHEGEASNPVVIEPNHEEQNAKNADVITCTETQQRGPPHIHTLTEVIFVMYLFDS